MVVDEGQDRPELKTTPGWPDGRRKFGTVSKAIIDVVSAAEHELPVKEIHAGVEARLGSTVSRFSVSDYLLTRSKGSKPLFERTRHGHYRTYRPGSAEEE